MEVSFATVLAIALTYAGMGGLCLAMDRHHTQVWTKKSPHLQRLLRVVGWALLVLALWPCIRAWGPSVGVVNWIGFLSASAFALVLMLPYWPRSAALLAGVATLGGLPLLLFGAA
ncbi:DUF3325 domain-containing protein [Pseudomonas sp. LRF_L74]|uniref:DUF3325 domain-containing protein n=1 Tax=Pseudomonas sp. LRF_L74 TaxID=3369422 RepID=UPI003F5F1874